MPTQSHGGKRLGAGHPRVGDVQLTARVIDSASKSIKAHGLGDGIAAGVRRGANLSAAITAALPLGNAVLVSFQPLAGSKAKTIEEAYREIVNCLVADGSRPTVYRCERNLRTVNARIALGNDTPLWLSVPAKRIQLPNKQEYQVEIGKIKDFLVEARLDAVWA